MPGPTHLPGTTTKYKQWSAVVCQCTNTFYVQLAIGRIRKINPLKAHISSVFPGRGIVKASLWNELAPPVKHQRGLIRQRKRGGGESSSPAETMRRAAPLFNHHYQSRQAGSKSGIFPAVGQSEAALQDHSHSTVLPMGRWGNYSASQLGAVCMSAPLSWWLFQCSSCPSETAVNNEQPRYV